MATNTDNTWETSGKERGVRRKKPGESDGRRITEGKRSNTTQRRGKIISQPEANGEKNREAVEGTAAKKKEESFL